MKNSVFLFVLAMALSIQGLGQANFNDSLARSRNTLTEHYMVTLGAFALVNIGSGFLAAAQTREATYAWRMNAYWNFINLGIAGLGYLGARRALLKTYSLAENEKAQLSVEKTYVLNFGLDLVYIAGGFYLRERGVSETNLLSKDQYRGYGTSIAIQGGCLAVMDAIMTTLHHHNSARLNNKLKSLELHAGPGAVALTWNL